MISLVEDLRNRGIGFRFSANGNEEVGANLYRWEPIIYRAPLYKKWLYWQVSPVVTWRRADNWEPIPSMRFTIEALFWGTEER